MNHQIRAEFNPVPANATLYEGIRHRLNDCGRYIHRAVVSLFVKNELSQSYDVAKTPFKSLENRTLKVAIMKLFVGTKSMENFADYAFWHQNRYGEGNKWNKYNTTGVRTIERMGILAQM